MSSLLSATEKASMLNTFEQSFDTWSRNIIVYKEPLKQLIAPQPSTQQNAFGFGPEQQNPTYTFIAPVTGIFPAVIRDTDIENSRAQAAGMPLAPELISRILASPVSMKVRPDARAFIDKGQTDRIVDIKNGETYLLNGHACLQTYQGSEYYIYPLRKTQ